MQIQHGRPCVRWCCLPQFSTTFVASSFVAIPFPTKVLQLAAKETRTVDGKAAGEDTVRRHFENIRAFIKGATAGKIVQKDAPVAKVETGGGARNGINQVINVVGPPAVQLAVFEYNAFSSAGFLTGLTLLTRRWVCLGCRVLAASNRAADLFSAKQLSTRRNKLTIQYSGNAQTSTFTVTTKQNIIDSIETALIAAGWTTISGHATTNLLMQSATTPQGFAINVRLMDNAGVSVDFSLESTDGTLVGTNTTSQAGGFLQPNAGWVYQVICNKYQAFIFATPDPGVPCSYVGFGVPFLPTWMTAITTRVGWMHGNGVTDNPASGGGSSFRTSLFGFTGGSTGAMECLYNSVLWYGQGSNSPAQLLIPTFTAPAAQTNGTGYRWESGAALITDALIGWAATSYSAGEAKFKGQIWDACVTTDAYTSDLTTTFDSHNWQVLTDTNTSNNEMRGSLIVTTS